MTEQTSVPNIGKRNGNMAADEGSRETLRWLSPMSPPFYIAGFAWLAQDGKYRRLPVSPRYPLPPAVDSLANCTAGGQIRFCTDSRKLSLRVRLSGVANMCHMPATGQCGFDCYLGMPGEQLYLSTTKYDHTKPEFECVMFDLPESENRNVTLYFPLYQGVEEVLIGIEPDAQVFAPPPYVSDRRVVVYGTSITQGGCASRSGMAYTNILSRRIPLEFINLGFSGNGKGEPEVARIISEIPNPACFVLDYEANVGEAAQMEQTLPEFIRILRERHPDTPILVLSKIRFARENFDEGALAARLKKKQIQMETVKRLRSQGDERVFFHDGSGLLGDDFHECTVDGVHPTDLGFHRMADGLAPVLEQILARQLA